jgi:signal peptidase II
MSKPTIFLLAAFVVALDQLTKQWAVRHLDLDVTSVTLIPNVFYLTRTSNTGSAFGLFPAATGMLAAVAFVAAAVIAGFVVKHKGSFGIWIGTAVALPLGGTIGNFLDRVRLGYVIDFLDLRIGTYHWPVFNAADSSICIGVALLALFFVKHGGAQQSARPDSEEPSSRASE